ncbi:unnamed protein product [Trichobilharzia szidati]|nr:unnamed protein product [Trichobilharzia szidati]
MNSKFCRLYCFNDGSCTSCRVEQPLHETQCLGCVCPREWAGQRCEKRIKFLSTAVSHTHGYITSGIFLGVLLTIVLFTIILCITKHKVVKNLWIQLKINCLRKQSCKEDTTSVAYATYTNDEAFSM